MSTEIENLQASAENRVMFLTTPLEDAFLLNRLSVREGISELFLIRAEIYSQNPAIDFDAIIGQNVTVRLETPGGGGRFFNGVVSRFTQGDTKGDLTGYDMEVSPWFWFLSQTQNCRIFPNRDAPIMSIGDILQSVFTKYEGFEFELQLQNHSPVAYCVQYLESDFAFCSRIMEETGFGYYFVHEENTHKLIVFDRSFTPPACPTHDSVRYWPNEGGADEGLDTDFIKSFRASSAFHSGVFTTSDFNPDDPGNHNEPGGSLLATTPTANPAGGKDRFETFHYPGRFEMLQDGDALTKQLANVCEQHASRIDIDCECSGFTSGHKFKMVEHPRGDFNCEYLINSIEHKISQPIGLSSTEDPIEYRNKTKCTPLLSDVIAFLPKEKTPKPIITGVHVATVVSPDKKGMDLDEKGRILVKFPWDREANTSSCRVRVSQSQAGKGWGGISIPHTGQEVLVSYIGGDPDRPIVVGRVYNAANLPDLDPGKQTRTAIRNHGGVLLEMEGGAVPDEA